MQPVPIVEFFKPWFTFKPIGRNTLNKISVTKVVSVDSTGVSDLYQAGVPEKIIQECSGHLSLVGFRQCQHIIG